MSMDVTIQVNKVSRFRNVRISSDFVSVELGLHDDAERKQLAAVLLQAASELLEGLEDKVE